MITIFNREELINTFSMKKQSEVRNILADHGIAYKIKTINRKSASPMSPGSRARTGTFGENLELAYEYIIYVKREDYEKASYLIRK